MTWWRTGSMNKLGKLHEQAKAALMRSSCSCVEEINSPSDVSFKLNKTPEADAVSEMSRRSHHYRCSCYTKTDPRTGQHAGELLSALTDSVSVVIKSQCDDALTHSPITSEGVSACAVFRVGRWHTCALIHNMNKHTSVFTVFTPDMYCMDSFSLLYTHEILFSRIILFYVVLNYKIE